MVVFDFINERLANFVEPVFMGRKPAGLSRKKFEASHYTALLNWELEEVAKKVKTSLALTRKWRTEYTFKHQEADNLDHFRKYWGDRMVKALYGTGGATFDVDKLLQEFSVYSFAARVEIGHVIEDLAEAHPAFPFLNGLYWKSLNRHIFLSSTDYRRKDTKREKPESHNKTMTRIEENLDRVIDYIGTYVEDSEGKSLIFDKLYFLVSNVNRLNA